MDTAQEVIRSLGHIHLNNSAMCFCEMYSLPSPLHQANILLDIAIFQLYEEKQSVDEVKCQALRCINLRCRTSIEM